MPAPLISKDEVVVRLFETFRDYGYDGATLAELARATGLGRSSLYHYFPGGKEDMARAVLDYVDAWFAQHALAPLAAKGPPHERLQRMLDSLDTLYAGGKNACLLGNLVVGNARPLFQQRLRAAFSTWMNALESLAIEAGVSKRLARSRAEDAVLMLEGVLILAAGLNDPAPFRRVLRAIPSMLLASDGEPVTTAVRKRK